MSALGPRFRGDERRKHQPLGRSRKRSISGLSWPPSISIIVPLTISINGGFSQTEAVHQQLRLLDGVMVGREAYHNPWWLAQWDAEFFGEEPRSLAREEIEERMCDYMVREAAAHGTHWYAIARHMLGLRNGLPGARRWRQVWSDHRMKHLPPHEVMRMAHARVDKELEPLQPAG